MENTNNISVLWLPGWYPTELEPYNGDFIQRHARAVAMYCRVHVIHVIRDTAGTITRNVKTVHTEDGNLKETIIYYFSPPMWPRTADRLFSASRYLRLYKAAITTYLAQNRHPLCAHLYIGEKNSLLALWLKKKYNIPFVVSEQWTLFLDEAVPQFGKQPAWFRNMWKKAMTQSAGAMAVSRYLCEALQRAGNPHRCRIIPNVVDHRIFYPPAATTVPASTHFVHISNLNYQKNFEDILLALAIVKKAGKRFTVSVYGPHTEALLHQTRTLNLEDEVQYHGEAPQPVLADTLRAASAFIQYSRYETFGCVIIEANACGLPVILSDIPVHHETVVEGVNGYFVRGEDPQALADKLIWFIEQQPAISKQALFEQTREKYGYEVTGNRFFEWYRSFLPDPSR